MRFFAVLPLLALGASAYVVTDAPTDGAVQARQPASGAVHAIDSLQAREALPEADLSRRHHKGKGNRGGKGRLFGRDAAPMAEAVPEPEADMEKRHHKGKGNRGGKGRLFGREAEPEADAVKRHHKGKGNRGGKGRLFGREPEAEVVKRHHKGKGNRGGNRGGKGLFGN